MTITDINLLVFFDEKIARLFDMSGLKFEIEEKLNTKADVIAEPLREDT